jgi:hypothetical protein
MHLIKYIIQIDYVRLRYVLQAQDAGMLLFRGKFNASIQLSKSIETCCRLPFSFSLKMKVIT